MNPHFPQIMKASEKTKIVDAILGQIECPRQRGYYPLCQ